MNTSRKDFSNQNILLAKRLFQRGYTKAAIESQITKASNIIKQKMPYEKVYQKKKHSQTNKADKILYFQRTYHPRTIPSALIQKSFKKTIAYTKLFHRLIICNKRPKNIRDILSSSTLPNLPGQNPSNYIQEEGTFRDI